MTRFDVAAGALNWAWTTVLPGGASASSFVVGPEGVTAVGSGAIAGQPVVGGADAFVFRVNPEGALAWVRQFGTIYRDAATDVVVTPNGTVVVAGSTDGALGGQTTQGGSDAFIARFGADGSLESMRQFGSGSDDLSSRLLALPNGTLILAGSTNGVLEPGHVSQAAGELFVSRLDASGGPSWTRQFSISTFYGELQPWGDDFVWFGSRLIRVSSDGVVRWAADLESGDLQGEFLAIDSERASWRGFRNLRVLAPTPWTFELFEYIWSADGGSTASTLGGSGWPQRGSMLVENPAVGHGPNGEWYAAGSPGAHPAPNNLVTLTRHARLGGAPEELRTWVFDEPEVAQRATDRTNIFPTALKVSVDGTRVMLGGVRWGTCEEVYRLWLMGF